MTDGVTGGLGDAIGLVAARLPGIERVDDPVRGAVELRRGGLPFVRLEPDVIHFRLDPTIAAAARRTPGVAASAAGAGWVAFRPSTLDRFSLDRAAAWTELAWRLSGDDGSAEA